MFNKAVCDKNLRDCFSTFYPNLMFFSYFLHHSSKVGSIGYLYTKNQLDTVSRFWQNGKRVRHMAKDLHASQCGPDAISHLNKVEGCKVNCLPCQCLRHSWTQAWEWLQGHIAPQRCQDNAPSRSAAVNLQPSQRSQHEQGHHSLQHQESQWQELGEGGEAISHRKDKGNASPMLSCSAEQLKGHRNKSCHDLLRGKDMDSQTAGNFAFWPIIEAKACHKWQSNVETLNAIVNQHWEAMDGDYIKKSCKAFRRAL